MKNYLLALPLLLTACAAAVIEEPAPPTATELAAELNDVPSFWQVDGCQIAGQHGPIKLAFSPYLSNESVYVDLIPLLPLAEDPTVRLTTWPEFVPLIGTGPKYSFEVPYSPRAVNRLMHSQSYVVVDYQQQNADESYKAVFPTRELPDLVKDVAAKDDC